MSTEQPCFYKPVEFLETRLIFYDTLAQGHFCPSKFPLPNCLEHVKCVVGTLWHFQLCLDSIVNCTRN